jgi:hypothetical protein
MMRYMIMYLYHGPVRPRLDLLAQSGTNGVLASRIGPAGWQDAIGHVTIGARNT